MKKSRKTINKAAFTLMELMIVIIIMGMLAAVVLPNLTGQSEQAKQKLACTQMKIIYESVKSFKLDNGRYPTTEEGLNALISSPDSELTSYRSGGYLDDGKIPKDSWGSDFIYTYDDKVEIISLGGDKKEGGSDEATDIYMSTCK